MDYMEVNCFFCMFNKLSFHILGDNPDLSGGGYTTASEVRGLQLDSLGVLFSAHFFRCQENWQVALWRISLINVCLCKS